MNISIIGLGLIGGSIGLALRKTHRVIGFDQNPTHAKRAVERGLVEEHVTWPFLLDEADIVILGVPVGAIREMLPFVLDRVRPDAVVLETGSTKQGICEAVSTHPKRGQFVACHPIAGTEFSGPDAAQENLLLGKTCIIVEGQRSSDQAVRVAQDLWKQCGMVILPMEADAHDRSLAYVSHLSHALAFVLAQTVADLPDSDPLDRFAGSGLVSMVRLAKSSPDTWASIFLDNRSHVVAAIEDWSERLEQLKKSISDKNESAIKEFIQKSNTITKRTGAL